MSDPDSGDPGPSPEYNDRMSDPSSSFPPDGGFSQRPSDDIPSMSAPESGGPPSHAPAPGGDGGWRPMSGLAITAFVLSLLLGLGSLGLWWVAVVPLALGIWGIVAAVPAKYRGRGFAIAATVIGLLLGSCSFMIDKQMKSMAVVPAEGILRDLAADSVDEAERDHRLGDWLTERIVAHGPSEEPVADPRLAEIKDRYRQVVERMGAYQGAVTAGTLFSSWITVFMGPQGQSMDEIGAAEGATFPTPGRTFWSVATFEQGDVHVAIMLGDGGPNTGDQTAWAEGRRARIVGDVRFFVPPTSAP